MKQQPEHTNPFRLLGFAGIPAGKAEFES